MQPWPAVPAWNPVACGASAIACAGLIGAGVGVAVRVGVLVAVGVLVGVAVGVGVLVAVAVGVGVFVGGWALQVGNLNEPTRVRQRPPR